MRNTFILVFGFCVLCFSEAVEYENCAGSSSITDVQIERCESNPCNLVSGLPYHIEVTFKPKQFSKTLNFHVYGIWSDTKRVSLTHGDFCHHLKGKNKCPIKTGQLYHVRYPLVIPDYVPESELVAEVLIKAKTGTVIGCARFRLNVVKPTI